VLSKIFGPKRDKVRAKAAHDEVLPEFQMTANVLESDHLEDQEDGII
jgi:hypothetical protein